VVGFLSYALTVKASSIIEAANTQSLIGYCLKYKTADSVFFPEFQILAPIAANGVNAAEACKSIRATFPRSIPRSDKT
jgi:hypothetical protein